MNILDIIIIFMLLFFAIGGWKKGIIKESVSLAGLVIVFTLSYIFKNYIGDFLCKYLPFFNFSGALEGLSALNIIIYQLIGFFILCSALMGVYSIIVHISSLFQKLINATIILRLPSKLAGLIVGLIEGYLIMFMIILVVTIPLSQYHIYQDSKISNYMLYKTPILSKSTNAITKSVEEITSLIEDVGYEKIDKNSANLKIIDISLKYKVTSKHTIEQLVVLDKLKKIDNIDSVLANY